MRAVLWMAALALSLPAQVNRQTRELAPGCFLVAKRNLPDPNFAESVVLLISFDHKGALGLTINNRSKVTIARLFDEMKEARSRTDPVYMGGPVQLTGVLALLRSKTKQEDTVHVFGEVYMVKSKAVLEKMMGSGADSRTFRVYLGYSGWGAGQLEGEVEQGAWHVLRADADTVFDPDPDSVWMKLVRRTELQIAGLRLD